jgi:PTS system ascorbate-specific IIA component
VQGAAQAGQYGVNMIGILIISHGGLGEALADGALHILGHRPDNLAVLGVEKHEDPDAKLAQARDIIARIDGGQGVLILTDMYGGTPSNVASRLVEPGRIEAVAGANLPMLVRALSYSGQALDVVVGKAVTGGLEGVLYIIPGEGNVKTTNRDH